MSTSSLPVDAALQERAINTIRILSAEAVQKAKSGHPGMPMGMAAAALTLWSRFLRHSPSNPAWANRDRFVLSAGHGSMLLYSLLYLTGYDLPLEELMNFRQWGSKTPGHPEAGHTAGVETTTGPLGQGFTNGVGMAMAERWLAERYNRPGFPVVDHYTYAIVSDGDLMEGIASEAASLAGHLKLGKLIYLYDDNHISIEGSTNLAYTEAWAQRFEAYGWHVQKIDGMDTEAVAAAITAAQADPRPSLIGCHTTIGYGSPNRSGTSKAHGEPLGEEELRLTKEALGWPLEPSFFVPEEVLDFTRQAVPQGKSQEAAFAALFNRYRQDYADVAAELEQALSGQLPDGWQSALPTFAPGKGDATRNSAGAALNALATVIPNLIGGSADLAPSNKTDIKDGGNVTTESFAGRIIHFGVREHAMAGILNGMALHGGIVPFGGTFLVFSDYMRGSMRLAAIMGLRVVYVLTHDSVGVGEDGPTHQPVEQVAALRVIPNMTVIRPGDANEAAYAWRAALENSTGPTALALSRQNMPTFDRSAPGMGGADGVLRGGYVLYDSGVKPEIVLLASGSELGIAFEAAQTLVAEGVVVRVVSLPSWELFQKQEQAYRDQVLPVGPPRLAMEAGSPFGWERWVGNDKGQGDVIAIDRFGASAPYARVYEELGLTVEAMVERARHLLGRK